MFIFTSSTLGKSDKGTPNVTSEKCSVSVGNVDVTFHGGFSWLYNLFSSTISDSLKSSIEDQVYTVAVFWLFYERIPMGLNSEIAMYSELAA